MYTGVLQEIQKAWPMQWQMVAKAAGAEVSVFETADFDAAKVDGFDAIAFGCPAMGDEVLEEDEFEPMFSSCEAKLSGQKDRAFWILWLGRWRMDAQLGR